MKDRPTERHSLTQRSVVRCSLDAAPQSAAQPDAIAVEEPLEIRVATDTLATIMRTPGEDHFLAAGFLYAEGIIRELADLGRVAHCGRPAEPGYGNVIDIMPGPGTALAPELAGRRGTLVSAACGVCGRERIDDLIDRLGRIPSGGKISAAQLRRGVERLGELQSAHARSGAMHGALACAADGSELACSEDVGRHNAVDKVIGKLLYAGQLSTGDARAAMLVVSGRTSFEIVQKAVAARISTVVSVSGPTSLSIDLAEALGVTLVGFARGSTFNVYAHAPRILWP